MDKELHIETTGIVEYYADSHHNRYEPTDYRVLEKIRKYIHKESVLLDYGCGKGRVDFYFRKFQNCSCIGVDYNEEMIQSALDNLKSSKLDRIDFICADATQYEIPSQVNCFYFFNPFSVQILQKVLNRILDSYYENPREMTLLFYFPSEEYIYSISSQEMLNLVEEIVVNDIFNTNLLQERILVYKIF